jgi:hypothetical protein
MQGAQVTVTLKNGQSRNRRLPDVVPATPDRIRERYRNSATAILGSEKAVKLEELIGQLENENDAAQICVLARKD